jgi:hypothetical protein
MVPRNWQQLFNERSAKLNAFEKMESQPASETQYSFKKTRWTKSKER